MAHMTVDGADALIDDMAELARLPNEIVEGALDAMADVVLPAQREEIRKQWNGPYAVPMSAECIKKSGFKKELDGTSVSIYPQGTRTRGKQKIRNGEIAFLNEYGAPTREIAARPAISTATAKKEQEAVEAGERVYHAYLDSKNM